MILEMVMKIDGIDSSCKIERRCLSFELEWSVMLVDFYDISVDDQSRNAAKYRRTTNGQKS